VAQRSGWRGGRLNWLIAPVATVVLVATVAAAADLGRRDLSYTGTTAPTGQKPQSKLWFNDGSWWGALFNTASSHFEIFRLDWATQTWAGTGVRIDDRSNVRQDVLWDGRHLYVASSGPLDANTDARVASAAGRIYSFSYQNGTYTADAGFPVTVVPDGGAEAMVLAEETTTGRLWVTYTVNFAVRVAHSTTNPQNWVAPYVLPVANANNITDDDISSVVAFNGHIGVMWGNQTAGIESYLFAVHTDNSSDTAAGWSLETALGGEPELADDHISLKVGLANDPAGEVFAAVKTSRNDHPTNAAIDPLIVLLRRRPGGGWTRHTVATVPYQHTRATVLIDGANRQVYVFASSPCCSGGTIYSKQMSLDALANNNDFPIGLGAPFLSLSTDPKTNNVTSTKQTLDSTTGLVVEAGDDATHRYTHNWLPLGTPPTPTIPETSIQTGPSATTSTTSALFSFSSVPAGATFQCSLDGSNYVGCSSPTSYAGPLSLGQHSFAVRAANSAGTDPSPAIWSWSIVLPTDVTIDSGPPPTGTDTTASFTFHSSSVGATFECTLDGDAFNACSTPKTYSALVAGEHTFRVRAVTSGGAMSSPASWSWTILGSGSIASFYDGFESGNLTAWTNVLKGTGTTDFAGVEAGGAKAGAWAARLTAGTATGSFAYIRRALSSAATTVTVTADVKVLAEGASGANVPIVRLFDPSGARVVSLYRQNQSGSVVWISVGGTRYVLTGTLPLGVWKHFELRIVAGGSGASTVTVRSDGVTVFSTVTATLATTGIKTVQFGNETKAQAFSLLADEVRIASS
jgi:hypothetical protein